MDPVAFIGCDKVIVNVRIMSSNNLLIQINISLYSTSLKFSALYGHGNLAQKPSFHEL